MMPTATTVAEHEAYYEATHTARWVHASEELVGLQRYARTLQR